MSLSLEIAQRALRQPSMAEKHRLRVLSFTNLAAARGDMGSMTDLVEQAAGSEVPAERARHLAMAMHARTQDDFHPAGRVHVGAIVLAAVLALAEEAEERMFECLTAGYDVLCLTSMAYSGEAQARGLRPSGMFGPLAAAAAAGVAIGLGDLEVANAIGLASTMSAGTNQAWLSGTDEWLLEVGAAARAGVVAAELSAAGVRASPEALEGRAGWARAFFGDDRALRLADRVERGDSGLAGVAVKLYPVSGIAQVPTWLACRAHPFAGEPDAVVCAVSEAELGYPGSANRGPFRSRSDALMSIAFCVSCGLADGLVGLARLEAPNSGRPRELMERVQVVAEPTLEEGHAELRIGPDRTQAAARDVLFPAWEDLRVAEVAERSEAFEPDVSSLHAALGEDVPSPVALRDILGSHFDQLSHERE